jgi:transposase
MAVRKQGRGLEVAHPNAAGIDVGSASHFVAVPLDRDGYPAAVRRRRAACSPSSRSTSLHGT